MIPLRRRPLEKGRGRVYRDRMSGQWFADFRHVDGSIRGVWASDITDGNEWCIGRAGLDRPHDPIDFAAVASQRERRSTNV